MLSPAQLTGFLFRGLYDGYDANLQRALQRARRVTGRWVPRMAVIPPGVDFDRVKPVDLDAPPEGDDEPPIWKEIARFLRNPRKPAILALARPDAKKNLVRRRSLCTRPSLARVKKLTRARVPWRHVPRRTRSFARMARTTHSESWRTSSSSRAIVTGTVCFLMRAYKRLGCDARLTRHFTHRTIRNALLSALMPWLSAQSA